MNKPVVLITGALTGIGRATAIAFAKDGAASSSPAAGRPKPRLSRPNFAAWAPKPRSSRPTSVDGGKAVG
jgi:NAD(P)-dependent dehydrogenase (short-subunit alcohol dehydrogenase family)